MATIEEMKKRFCPLLKEKCLADGCGFFKQAPKPPEPPFYHFQNVEVVENYLNRVELAKNSGYCGASLTGNSGNEKTTWIVDDVTNEYNKYNRSNHE